MMALDFTGADNGIHLWNLFEDLVAIAFHQAAGDNKLFRQPNFLCSAISRIASTDLF